MGRHGESLYSAVVLLIIVVVVRTGECAKPKCKASITTASGSHAPKGKICTGELIFHDDFEKLDLSKWQHESTLTGGGVSSFCIINGLDLKMFQTTNKGTQKIDNF